MKMGYCLVRFVTRNDSQPRNALNKVGDLRWESRGK